MAFICELCGIQVCRGRPFLHTHSHSTDTWDRPAMVDFMNRFPDTFCTVTDSCLIGPNNLTKGMETLTVAQAFGTTTHSRRSRRQHPSNYSQTCVVAATEQSEDRPLLPKQDILMKNLKWNGMRRTMSRVDPLDPHEVKIIRHKGNAVFMGQRCMITPPKRSRQVCTEVRHEAVEPSFTASGSSAS